jgi:hypothetical protein
MKLRRLLALALPLAACAAPPSAPAVATPAVAVAPAARRDHESPVIARWVTRAEPAAVTGRQGAGDRLVLVARVEQPGHLGLPLRVSIEAPDGVTQTRGPQRYTVAPGAPGAVHEAEVEFAVTAVPGDDLVLVVDAQGAAAGYHARVPYRFGRPAPAIAPPPLTATAVTVGGTSAGPAVDMGRPR